MKAYIIVATKGRAKETYELLNSLQKQTHPIEQIIVVGSEILDTDGLDSHPLALSNAVTVHHSNPGLTTQRNAGLDLLRFKYTAGLPQDSWFVVFLDDDFRPAPDWVAECANGFQTYAKAVGIGGCVLADGITTKKGLTEAEASSYLNGYLTPNDHFWSGKHTRTVSDLYGCNMAYRGTFALNERFDENLPFYGWQEDVDYSMRASQIGELIYLPRARGVHLGVTGGRTSGLRFGYSQIANPTYLLKKNSIKLRKAILLMTKNILSNVFRTITFNTSKDYRGRLYGNYLAFCDFLRGQCHPLNVKKL